MGHVYFFRRDNQRIFKIGRAKCLERRAKTHSTSDPWLQQYRVIETEDEIRLEKFLHGYLQSKRLKGEFYALTEAELSDAITAAEKHDQDFVPVLRTVERLKSKESDGERLPSDPAKQTMYENLVRLREEKFRIERECEQVENQLKLAIGTHDEIAGLVSWKSQTCSDFAEKDFRNDHPKLYEKYLRQRVLRKFVSCTRKTR